MVNLREHLLEVHGGYLYSVSSYGVTTDRARSVRITNVSTHSNLFTILHIERVTK